VIARGELKAKVDLKVQAASASVVTAIEKAGGSFEKVATPLRKSMKEAEEK
jgi:ribosomal protein L18e/L15